MKNFLIVSAALALISGTAGAVTLKNTNKDTESVFVDSAGKQETIRLKSGEIFDSKGKDASFTYGKNEPVTAKGAEKLIIQGDKLVVTKAQTRPEVNAGKQKLPQSDVKPTGDEAIK